MSGKIAKNDLLERASFLLSPFFLFPVVHFSSSCIFFIIWHLPLQCILALALFTQFLANVPVVSKVI